MCPTHSEINEKTKGKDMIVKLTLLDRINIDSVMPQDGTNWQTRQLIRGLGAKLVLTAKDQEEFDIKTTDPDEHGQTRTTWNNKGSEEQPFDLHAKEIALIHGELEKLDKAEKLLPQHDSLCEKFLDEQTG